MTSLVLAINLSLEAEASPITIDDPAGDDHGGGQLLYPSGVKPGSADILEFTADFSGDLWAFSVLLRQVSSETRLNLSLIDRFAMENKLPDYTIGGTELRLPFWNQHGVNILLALPGELSPLFDYNVTHPYPKNQPRPDNSIYVNHAPTRWMNSLGMPTDQPTEAYRLPIIVQQEPGGTRLSLTIPRELLTPYLSISPGGSVFVALFSYLTVPAMDMSYGAYEVGPEGGAMSSWQDPDAYDLAFVGSAQKEVLALNPDHAGDDALVTLCEVGKGILSLSLED